MSHYAYGYNYALPNNAYLLQNSSILQPSRLQIVSEEERINAILHSTNPTYPQTQLASFISNYSQPIHHSSQLTNWYTNQIQSQQTIAKNTQNKYVSDSQTSSNFIKTNKNNCETSSNEIDSTHSNLQTLDKNTANSPSESSHSLPVDATETYSNKKEKSKVRTHNFYFLIPHFSHKIINWKSSKIRKSKEVTTTAQNPSNPQIAQLEIDQQQSPQSKPNDIDILCDDVINFDLDIGTGAEMKEDKEYLEELKHFDHEIISISASINDIDKIISQIKHRKQQKVHHNYELIKSPIIVTRIMTHKRIMCHSIRGRQRGKRKRKFQHFSFNLTISFHPTSNSTSCQVFSPFLLINSIIRHQQSSNNSSQQMSSTRTAATIIFYLLIFFVIVDIF